MTIRFARIAGMLVATSISACRGDAPRSNPDTGRVVPRAETTATRPPQDSSTPSAPPTMSVTEHGIGPLRAGMTFADASAALGGALLIPVGVDTTGCDYLVWRGAPPGVQVMFDEHRIARIDVDTSTTATSAGARVGDDEARIQRLYAGKVRVTPHKYQDGHYLTVIPTPADPRFRIIFETLRGRVTRYRAGMMPSVEYVEGCS